MQRIAAFRIHRRPRVRRSGWTKVEILGLVAVLIVGAFVLRPVFRGARDINQLTTIAKGLGSRLLEARIRAKDEKRIYACYVKPGTGRYQIGEWTGRTPDGKRQPGVNRQFLKAEHVKQHELPAGMSFVMVDVKLDEQASELGLKPDLSRLTTGEWSLPILFYPDETNLAAKFVLTFQDQYFVNVTLDPKTGESKVGPSYEVETPTDNKEPYDPLKDAGRERPK